MSRWDILPDTVKAYIFEYDDFKYKKLKKCLSEIQIKGCLSRMKYIQQIYIEQTYNNPGERLYIYDTIKQYVPDYKYISNKLAKCKCCSRHQYQKPCLKDLVSIIDYGKYLDAQFTRQNNTIYYCNKEYCSCSCRRYSRQIYHVLYD